MLTQIDVFVDYFGRKLPTLARDYHWPIPNIEGFALAGESGYGPNLELKRFLHRIWHSAADVEKLTCAKVIVADWGGVRRNKDTTLQNYIAEIESANPATPFSGVASYSKIFSVAYPQKYAIYDARVSACLNAIQYQYDVDDGTAFNYCSGRNNIIGNASNKKGFVHMKPFQIATLVSRGWKRIKRNDTYQTYLALLRRCQREFGGHELHDLEMTLFANAEAECSKAITMAGPRP